MVRSLMAGAAALGIVASAGVLNGTEASAQTAPTAMFDGVVIPTAGCNSSDTWRASYRPKIKATDPSSSIIVWADGFVVRIEKVGSGQFSSTGNFIATAMGDWDNSISIYGSGGGQGTFNFTQTLTPTSATVDLHTIFIEIDGPVLSPDGVHGVIECATAIHGVFSLRAPRTVVP